MSKRPKHDPELCGLFSGDFTISYCPACRVAESAPANRPGPQPENQIGTLREQLARAMGRPLPPLTADDERLRELIVETVRAVVAAELPAAVKYLVERHRNVA